MFRVKISVSASSPTVSVTSATYRLPSRIVSSPMTTPATAAIRADSSTAASGSTPWLVASCAVPIAPVAAKVAMHSQIMPPSPITMVKPRNTTANARPAPSRVSQ